MSSQQQPAADLFLANYDFVARIAFCFAPLPDLVDDVIQESFHRFAKQADRYDLAADIRPLLKTIVKNVAFDFWEKRQRERSKIARLVLEHVRQYGMEREATVGETENAPRYKHEQQALGVCLEKLPDRARTAVELYYYRRKKLSDIAISLETSLESIRQYLYRIRKKLRHCIDRRLRNAGEPKA